MSDGGPAPKRRNLVSLSIQAALALAVTVAALWWSFRGVDLSEVGPRLQQLPLTYIVVYVLALLVVHAVRVVRWGLLVKPLGPASNRAVFSAASVGIPAAMFFPLRLGEFVRPVMIARSGVPFAGGLASVVVERVADGLTNVGLFFGLLALLPDTAPVPPEIRTGSRIALALFGGALVVLILISIFKQPAVAVVKKILTPINQTLADKVNTLLETFLIGLEPLMQPARAFGFVALTLVYWGINGSAITLLMWGYGIEVPFLAGPFTMSVLVFAVMIPAGPAFAGTMQAGFKLGLAVFAIGATSAAVVGIAAHLVQIVLFAIIMGIGFLTAEPAQKSRSDEELVTSG